ncbi:MAG: phosphotransferase [Clostridia bacterium]|nr:phosphotransferase [Clostridia bacterium]
MSSILSKNMVNEGCLSYIVSCRNKKYFMKAVPPAFMDTAKQSAEILIYLTENAFPVPGIILTKDGLPYFGIDTPEENYLYILFNFIEGREPELGEDIEKIGTLVGRLHNIMQSYGGGLTIRGKPFFIDRYINILRKKRYPENKIAIFQEYGDVLWKRVENLSPGFCHGDLHRGNLLRTSAGEYFILDFDTSCNAFPVYDIMVLCDSTNYFKFERDGYKKSKHIYERFLTGYSRYKTLNDEEIKAFYDLIAIRHYQLQATIIEVNGLDCVDERFLDRQLDWLMEWRAQCEKAETGISLSLPSADREVNDLQTLPLFYDEKEAEET